MWVGEKQPGDLFGRFVKDMELLLMEPATDCRILYSSTSAEEAWQVPMEPSLSVMSESRRLSYTCALVSCRPFVIGLCCAYVTGPKFW